LTNPWAAGENFPQKEIVEQASGDACLPLPRRTDVMPLGKLQTDQLLEMTKEIVIAEITNNPVAAEGVPKLIQQVYDSLVGIAERAGAKEIADRSHMAGEGVPAARRTSEPDDEEPVEAPTSTSGEAAHAGWSEMEVAAATARGEGRQPAVPREKSVHPDYIVCLFDGIRRKMLKRHIKTRYGMSPEAYRHYWELGEDYPMTAPNYANEKRDYALMTGFGHSRQDRPRRGAA
jgi:predicted transcriptional regulator